MHQKTSKQLQLNLVDYHAPHSNAKIEEFAKKGTKVAF